MDYGNTKTRKIYLQPSPQTKGMKKILLILAPLFGIVFMFMRWSEFLARNLGKLNDWYLDKSDDGKVWRKADLLKDSPNK